MILDDPAALERRSGPARRRLAAGACALVVAEPGAPLAHVCRHVVTLRMTASGSLAARLERLDAVDDHEGAEAFTAAGLSPATALHLARRLAGWHDPELPDSTSLPTVAHLGSLLGASAFDPVATAALWGDRRQTGGASLRSPLGVADDGVIDVDLVARRPARPRRRHHRVRQERAAAVARRRARRRAPTRPPRSASCSSTTRAAARSTRAPRCRTSSAWSPISTPTSPSGRSAASRPSCGSRERLLRERGCRRHRRRTAAGRRRRSRASSS